MTFAFFHLRLLTLARFWSQSSGKSPCLANSVTFPLTCCQRPHQSPAPNPSCEHHLALSVPVRTSSAANSGQAVRGRDPASSRDPVAKQWPRKAYRPELRGTCQAPISRTHNSTLTQDGLQQGLPGLIHIKYLVYPNEMPPQTCRDHMSEPLSSQ